MLIPLCLLFSGHFWVKNAVSIPWGLSFVRLFSPLFEALSLIIIIDVTSGHHWEEWVVGRRTGKNGLQSLCLRHVNGGIATCFFLLLQHMFISWCFCLLSLTDSSNIVVLLQGLVVMLLPPLRAHWLLLFLGSHSIFSYFHAVFISLVGHTIQPWLVMLTCLSHLLNYKPWSQESALNILSISSINSNFWLFQVSYSIDT